MSTLLAVDPGIRGCGAALFVDEKLTAAAYVANYAKAGCHAAEARDMAHAIRGWLVTCAVTGRTGGIGPTAHELALEWPRVYASRIRAGKSEADPNDLLALAAVDAALTALLFPAPATCYAPSDWKGQMTKEACHARIQTRLGMSELTAAAWGERDAKSKAHNMWDAIGIGLHHLGRFARKRVIAP